MQVIHSPASMQRQALSWRRQGLKIGFVPTMGYLHAGHVSLIRRARRAVGAAGRVVVSIYVNPTQFAPTEDLSKYPRDLAGDLERCRAAGADAVLVPNDASMYPGRDEGRYSTYVVEERLTRRMEGESRPTHFRGVTTVVAKLFLLVQPAVAVFGAKDWQQASVIRRMVADLCFPVRVIVAPTVRERDGLAMSSRNKYLDPVQRTQATVLWRALQLVSARVREAAGRGVPVGRMQREVAKLVAKESQARLDYVAFFHPETLEPVTRVGVGVRVALAVYVGGTRLIDNAGV